MTDEEFQSLINALKQKALGNAIEQVVETWKKNDKGKMELTDKTVKKIMNDIDTQASIKLIDIELKRREIEQNRSMYDEMTDEQLEQEKQRLLKELFNQQQQPTPKRAKK